MNIKQCTDIRLADCGNVHLGTYSGETTTTIRINAYASNNELNVFNVDNRRLITAIRYYFERLISINDDEERRDSELVKELKEVAKVLAKLEQQEVTSDA